MSCLKGANSSKGRTWDKCTYLYSGCNFVVAYSIFVVLLQEHDTVSAREEIAYVLFKVR